MPAEMDPALKAALLLLTEGVRAYVAGRPALAAAAAEGRAVAYLHGLPRRIGQMGLETFALRTLYRARGVETVVIVLEPFLHNARLAFPEAIDACTDGLHIVALPPSGAFEPLYRRLDLDLGTLKDHKTGLVLRLTGSTPLCRDLFWALARGASPVHARLLPGHEAAGRALLADLGIPEGAPVVTVHCRESGYLADRADQDFRNADIATYVPAIEMLAAAGMYVVRLGDASMKPLPALGPRVVDGTRLDPVPTILTPYAIARSRFMINTTSGPYGVAQALGVPSVLVNAVLYPMVLPLPGDLYAPKIYRRASDGAPLPLREVLRHGWSEITTSEELAAAGLAVRDLTPEEIGAVVAERLSWEETGPPPLAAPASVALRRAAAEKMAGAAGLFDYFGMALPWARFPESYAAMNPGLLAPPAEG